MNRLINFFSQSNILLSALLVCIAVTYSHCAAKGNTTPAAQASAVSPAIPVDATIIRPSGIKESITVTGSLVANQQVDIVSELTRKVIKVCVKEGSRVAAGALLFKLDDADLLAQLEKLQQQEKLAMLNEQRLNDLVKHEAVVQQDYDQAFTNLKVLQAQIRELQVAIAKTSIHAPFAGQIGIVRVYAGALVSPTTVLANIEDNSSMKLDFSVPEKYANVINVGSQQHFTVASESKSFEATVIARESHLDAQTRTLLVRARAANPGGDLLAGQSARIELALRTANNALLVPSQALIPAAQGYSVFVIKNGKVSLLPIQTGQRDANAVEVKDGLHPGDTVVTSNLLRLTPGTAVQFVTLQ